MMKTISKQKLMESAIKSAEKKGYIVENFKDKKSQLKTVEQYFNNFSRKELDRLCEKLIEHSNHFTDELERKEVIDLAFGSIEIALEDVKKQYHFGKK